MAWFNTTIHGIDVCRSDTLIFVLLTLRWSAELIKVTKDNYYLPDPYCSISIIILYIVTVLPQPSSMAINRTCQRVGVHEDSARRGSTKSIWPKIWVQQPCNCIVMQPDCVCILNLMAKWVCTICWAIVSHRHQGDCRGWCPWALFSDIQVQLIDSGISLVLTITVTVVYSI